MYDSLWCLTAEIASIIRYPTSRTSRIMLYPNSYWSNNLLIANLGKPARKLSKSKQHHKISIVKGGQDRGGSGSRHSQPESRGFLAYEAMNALSQKSKNDAIESPDGGMFMSKSCIPVIYLLLLTVLSVSAQTIDVNTSTDNGSPDLTIVSQPLSTAYPNELLLACIAADSATTPNTTVRSITNTGPALNWALVKRTSLVRRSTGQLGTAELWAATATSQLNAVTVTAVLSQSVASSMTILGFPSASVGATGTGNANPGAPTASLTTTANGSLIIGVGNDFDNAIARTVGSGQTLLHQYLAPVQDTYWVQMLTSPVPSSGTTATVSDIGPSSDRFNMSIAEIRFGQPVPPPVPTTYGISGTVGIGGAKVALNGVSSASTIADNAGTFTFSNLANGDYVVTPSLAGYTFNPTSQIVTINSSSITGISFAAIAQPLTYSISGTITGSSGATVTLSGTSSATTTTNSSGGFTFSGLADGIYTITPNKAGYIFAPTSLPVSIIDANVTDISFIASAKVATYSLGGTITPASISSGATVTLSGAGTASTTVDSSGNFSFSSLIDGTYTVTPSSTSATFSPSIQTVTISDGSVSGISFTVAAVSQTACGNTLNWTDASCQRIGSGSLNPQWTVISRHGEYAQQESECNVPGAITQIPGQLSITMTASHYTCGDFSPSTGASCPSAGCDTSGGNVSPASWPYTTGDIQWNTFNICPGCSTTTYPTATACAGACTITVVGSMPSFNTGTWPAFWLLGQKCQDSNKYTGDTGADGCPYLGENGYIEIDTTECYGGEGSWCQFHVANPNFGIGNGCDAVYPVSTGQHTFQTVWTASNIKQYLDGTLVTTCNQSLTAPMFFIAQIQSATSSGMAPNDANLPAVVTLNSVTVTDANGNTLFSDDFPNQNQ